jgi:hypothetical protein
MSIAEPTIGELILKQVANNVSTKWGGTILSWDDNVPAYIEQVMLRYKERMTIWQQQMRYLVQDLLHPFLGEPTGTDPRKSHVKEIHLKVSEQRKLAIDATMNIPVSMTNDKKSENKCLGTATQNKDDSHAMNNLAKTAQDVLTTTDRNVNFDSRNGKSVALFQTLEKYWSSPRIYLLPASMVLAIVIAYCKICTTAS